MNRYVISVGGSFPREKSEPNTRLKFKEQQKIIKAVSEHSYLLSDGRTVMDVKGIQLTLNMRPEAVMEFVEYCTDQDKVIIDGKVFVYQSVVYKKAYNMNEQPFKMTKREKVRYGRNILVDQIRK
ncbi:hypothetical protein BBM20_11880 [Vibrio parahaemolyticus]|uniref:hypothetical protein n=1 Tax=Vibrio parahaemolyticus TaxID=670 RepID=UPI00084B3C7D|nr:hypothetical protein [Vibrio parahaemolyticus]EGQ8003255.1 hypothetical protein [Vibrio parahaemolyticus]EJC7017074.1 hypothetical protein [Vibrio parahaemolyticus]ODY30781.1 hypothetical protein BBM20_11880 [Vibrio parahaemolyticus]